MQLQAGWAHLFVSAMLNLLVPREDVLLAADDCTTCPTDNDRLTTTD
jgi:hypothetical protein